MTAKLAITCVLAFVALALTGAASRAQPVEDRVAALRAANAQCRHQDARALGGPTLAAVINAYGDESAEAAYVRLDLSQSAAADGRLAEAEQLSRSAVRTLATRFGADAPQAAAARVSLAVALANRGAYSDALALLSPAALILERAGGAYASHAYEAHAALRVIASEQGRLADALGHAERARAVAGDGPLALPAILLVADAARARGDWAGSQALLDRAVAMPNAGAFRAQLLLGRARLALDLRQLDVAIQALDGAATATTSQPCAERALAEIAYKRGDVLMLRRQALEAEAAYRTALSSFDRAGLSDTPRGADVRFGVANALAMQGRYEDADALMTRAAQIYAAAIGPSAPKRAVALSELAHLRAQAGDGPRALEAAAAASAAIDAAAEAAPQDRANVRAATGQALLAAGRIDGARAAFADAIAAFETASGRQSSDLPPSLMALAEIELAAGRPAEAARWAERALQIQEGAGWRSGLGLGRTQSLLADAAFQQGRVAQASSLSASAVDTLARRLAVSDLALSDGALGEQRRARGVFELDMAIAANGQSVVNDPQRLERMFRAGQLASATRTGRTLVETAARFASADTRMVRLLNERQREAELWRLADRQLIAALGAGAALDPRARSAMQNDLQAHAQRIAALDAEAARIDPRATALLRTAPLGVAEAAALLRTNEALLAYTVTARESFLVLVRGSQPAVAFRIALDRRQLEEAVGRLRAAFARQNFTGGQPPPFDAQGAFALYRSLIAPALPHLQGIDTLVLVPDAALAGFPVGALVVEPPPALQKPEDHAQVAWLAERYAIAVLPNVQALKALRFTARASRASRPFLGVGDPAGLAPSPARDRGEPPAPPREQIVDLYRGRLGDVGKLRLMRSLPDTGPELVEIAAALQADPARDLLVRERAQESVVRGADLRSYRIVAFATHAVIGGPARGYAEPALVLTPPAFASPADDGLLSASEIAQLEMDADWVILSACNTAASDGRADAEALSGLARAFMLAGSRALYVSHWYVPSRSTRDLSTAMARAARTSTRSKAAQAAQIDVMRSGGATARFAHPWYWAPFSLVGVD